MASLEVFASLVTSLALVQVVVRPVYIVDDELRDHPLPFALGVVRGSLNPVLHVDPVVVGLTPQNVRLTATKKKFVKWHQQIYGYR